MKRLLLVSVAVLLAACGGADGSSLSQSQAQAQAQARAQGHGSGSGSSTTNGGTTYNCSNGAVCGNNNSTGGNVGNGNTGGNSGSGNVTGNGNSGSSGVDGGGPSGAGYVIPAGPCVPFTCTSQGFNCGLTADGCGGVMNCGDTCPSGETCNGGGIYNVCGSAPNPTTNTTGTAWSSCFNPAEAYPTGILIHPTCTSYCQSIGKNLVNTCMGPSMGDGQNGMSESEVLVWCEATTPICGDLSQYPNYLWNCSGDTNKVLPCVLAGQQPTLAGTNGYTAWQLMYMPCNNPSVQCCCQ